MKVEQKLILKRPAQPFGRSFSSLSLGVALMAACGDAGTLSNRGDANGGTRGSSASSGGSGDAGTVDGGGTPGTGPIVCGSATCTGPQQVCCAGGSATGGDTCTLPSGCPNAAEWGSIYTCTGASNCADGRVCCVDVSAGPFGMDVALCQSTCLNRAGGAYQVCQTSAECSDGGLCIPIATRASVTTCQ
jgi:hypothetical protein